MSEKGWGGGGEGGRKAYISQQGDAGSWLRCHRAFFGLCPPFVFSNSAFLLALLCLKENYNIERPPTYLKVAGEEMAGGGED